MGHVARLIAVMLCGLSAFSKTVAQVPCKRVPSCQTFTWRSSGGGAEGHLKLQQGFWLVEMNVREDK